MSLERRGKSVSGISASSARSARGQATYLPKPGARRPVLKRTGAQKNVDPVFNAAHIATSHYIGNGAPTTSHMDNTWKAGTAHFVMTCALNASR
jgi:hypothetical protein